MLAHCCHGVPNCANALEITLNPSGLVGKALLCRRDSSVVSVGQDKWFAEQWAPYFMQVTDIDERNVTIEAERPQDRSFGILSIKPVDFVQRSLNGQRAVTIDRRGSAEMRIALKN